MGPNLAVAQAIADTWAELMLRSLIEGTAVLAIALAIWWPLRRRGPAQLGCGLAVLVLLKLALPFAVPLPDWLSVANPGRALRAATDWFAPALTVDAAHPTDAASAAATPVPGTGDGLTGTAAATPARAASGASLLLLGLWAAGVALLGLRFVVAQCSAERMARRARPATAALPVDPEALARRLHLRRPVPIYLSDDIDRPAAFGLLRPRILLPAELLRELTRAQLEWTLLHELAHVRRGDLWIALGQRVVQIAFFFHPATWIANRILDEQRELACDDMALAAGGLPRQACGQGFLKILEWSHGRRPAIPATLAMFTDKQLHRRRLMRILDSKRRLQSRAPHGWTLGLVALGLLVLPTADLAVAQEPAQRELRAVLRQLRELKREQAELRATLDALSRARGIAAPTRPAPPGTPAAPWADIEVAPGAGAPMPEPSPYVPGVGIAPAPPAPPEPASMENVREWAEIVETAPTEEWVEIAEIPQTEEWGETAEEPTEEWVEIAEIPQAVEWGETAEEPTEEWVEIVEVESIEEPYPDVEIAPVAEPAEQPWEPGVRVGPPPAAPAPPAPAAGRRPTRGASPPAGGVRVAPPATPAPPQAIAPGASPRPAPRPVRTRRAGVSVRPTPVRRSRR